MTTLMRRLVGVMSLYVTSVCLRGSSLVLAVRPRWLRPRCGECGHRASGYDRGKPRRWRALSYGTVCVHLEYQPRRVDCRRCGGVRVEKVPWAAHGSWFTQPFEELVAFHAQVSDKTTVTKIMGISWETVGRIVERVVARLGDDNRLSTLRRIGIDEFSYRKRHRYITVVVDHDTKRVVWAAEGRGAKTLGEFFERLGPEGVQRLERATIDMAGGYKKALREHAPHVEVIFDRFHVQKLASAAVDEVRRSIVRELGGSPQAAQVKGTRFIVLKNHENLTRREKVRLTDLERDNHRLYRAYLLKEALGHALDYRQLKRAQDALKEWLGWASRSRLKPFMKLARTIRAHRTGILAYIKERLTNGVVEGINNRIRTIARRSFGFHSASALIAMVHLCAGKIPINPPLPAPVAPTQP